MCVRERGHDIKVAADVIINSRKKFIKREWGEKEFAGWREKGEKEKGEKGVKGKGYGWFVSNDETSGGLGCGRSGDTRSQRAAGEKRKKREDDAERKKRTTAEMMVAKEAKKKQGAQDDR